MPALQRAPGARSSTVVFDGRLSPQPSGRAMRLVFRAAAWWIVMVTASFLMFTYSNPQPADGVGDVGPLAEPHFVLVPDTDRLPGAWVLFVLGLIGAVELWRCRKIGVLVGAALLSFLVVGGSLNWWQGDREPMAVVGLVLDGLFVAALARPVAWRACRKTI